MMANAKEQKKTDWSDARAYVGSDGLIHIIGGGILDAFVPGLGGVLGGLEDMAIEAADPSEKEQPSATSIYGSPGANNVSPTKMEGNSSAFARMYGPEAKENPS